MNLLLLQSSFDTLIMVIVSMTVGLVVGLPIAISLHITHRKGILPHPAFHHGVNFGVNVLRSIPYIILAVLMMPVTRFLVGSSIGLMASIIPLSLAACLLVIRVCEDALVTVPNSLIEVGVAMGAKNRQIITKIILPEALSQIVSGITTVTINIIGFSAMAGTVGGGGLGDLAIRYGYHRYDVTLMLEIVIILIAFVQGVQNFGNYLTKKLKK